MKFIGALLAVVVALVIGVRWYQVHQEQTACLAVLQDAAKTEAGRKALKKVMPDGAGVNTCEAAMRVQTQLQSEITIVNPLNVEIAADGTANVLANVTARDGSKQQCLYAIATFERTASGVSIVNPRSILCKPI